MTRRRAWTCWGIIAGSWIATKAYLILSLYPDVGPRAPAATPPAWTVGAACVLASLIAIALATRRGRACLRVRPRLSRPSLHGDTYLAAFALEKLLVLAMLLAIGALVYVTVDWSVWSFSTLLAVAGHVPGAAAVAYAFARVRSVRVPLGEWGWRRGRGVLRELSIGLGAGILIWLVWRLRGTLSPGEGLSFLRYGVSTVLVTPILEETLYRGALYRHLRDRMSWLPAAIVSSAVFAAMHSARAMPHAYASGLVYALLREWRGSLVAPVAAHAAWNALALAT